MLICTVQRVYVVVCPAARTSREMGLCHVLHNNVAQLGTESQVMNLVRKSVGVFILEVVLEIVYVQVAVGEGLSRCNMEVANDFVDLDATLEAAPFLALGIEVFGVVLALALLNAFAATERPGNRGVGVTNLTAGVTAAWLLGVGGGGGTVTFAAVVGSKVRGFVLVPVLDVSYRTALCICRCAMITEIDLQIQSLGLNVLAALILRAQSHLVDTMRDTHLQLS